MKNSINWQIGKTTTVVKFRVFENQNVTKNVHLYYTLTKDGHRLCFNQNHTLSTPFSLSNMLRYVTFKINQKLGLFYKMR